MSKKQYISLLALVLSVSVILGVKQMNKASIDTIFEPGEPNPYGQFFTGQTYLNMLSSKDDVWNAPIANVTFEPGARTNWHKHSGGQILLVLGGEGVIRNAENRHRFCKKAMLCVLCRMLSIGTEQHRIVGLCIFQ